MAAGFQLPSWGSLSSEQESIINMPTSRDYVVQGSPGTGKTVMALYRAARISQRDNCDVTILVYNRPLMMYVETATKSNSQFARVKVNTWHSWLNEFFKSHFHISTPTVEPFVPDWSEVKSYCQKVPNIVPHIIIDEGQDFPIELIECLKIVAKNITCFIDPNQAIEEGKTEVVDVLKSLFVECPKSLTINYRNRKPIADLSKLYWNQRGVFAEPNSDDIGMGGTGKPHVIQCKDFDELNELMCRIIKDNRGKNIGILTNNKWLNRVFTNLDDELDEEPGIDLQVYKAKARSNEIDFTKKGVKVMSFGTMKGLEFDLVIIVCFDMMLGTGDPNADMNRAYVAITRACQDLRITYFKLTSKPKWAQVMKKLSADKTKPRTQQLCTWE